MATKWASGALKSTAGVLDKGVQTAQGKLQDLILTEEAHRVSEFNWRRAMFKFRGTLHHGIPGAPTCLSFDPIQRLMAVGTEKGLVKLFGKPGVEVVVNQYEGSISHLCFLTNTGKLVLVHKGGSCEGVNVETRRSIGSYVFKGAEVTCLLHVPNTEFVCVGLSSGNVHVLSAAGKLAISSYRMSGRTNLSTKGSGVAGKSL
jgi:syntaxin-binding protein 5